MNYYEILGLEYNCTLDDIKKAFKTKAKVHHPDKGGDEETFKQLNEAYIKLTEEYSTPIYHAPYLHIHQVQNITLQDIYFGNIIKLRLGNSVIDLKIPLGVQSGTVLTYEGKGNKFRHLVGNLYVTLKIMYDDKVKQIDLLDIETEIDVSIVDIIKNNKIDVQLWNTHICTINIPKGTSSLSTIRIPNKGLTSRYKSIGDLYIKLRVKYPSYEDFNEDNKKLFDKLSEIL